MIFVRSVNYSEKEFSLFTEKRRVYILLSKQLGAYRVFLTDHMNTMDLSVKN